MRDSLIKSINEFEELDFFTPPDWWIEHFADHLLANGWKRPPCEVGDTVYEIQPIRQRIQAYDVTTVKYNGIFYWFTWILKGHRGHYGNVEGFSDMRIGKTVFLTREEAEKALKERERE